MNKKELADLLIRDNYTAWKKLLESKKEIKEQLEKLMQPFEERGAIMNLVDPISVKLLNLIRKGFEQDFEFENIKLYATPEYDDEQRKCIYDGVKANLDYEEIKVYADPKFTYGQMIEIFDGLTNSEIEIVKKWAKPKYTEEQMAKINEAFQEGYMSIDVIIEFADWGFTAEQLSEIYAGLNHDLSYDKVKFYANPKYTAEQMEYIRCGFEKGFTDDQIAVYASSELEASQMSVIFDAITSGISLDEIKLFAKPKYSKYVMEKIYTLIKEYRVDVNLINLCISSAEEVTNVYIDMVIDDVRRLNFSQLVEKYDVSEELINAMQEDILNLL